MCCSPLHSPRFSQYHICAVILIYLPPSLFPPPAFNPKRETVMNFSTKSMAPRIHLRTELVPRLLRAETRLSLFSRFWSPAQKHLHEWSVSGRFTADPEWTVRIPMDNRHRYGLRCLARHLSALIIQWEVYKDRDEVSFISVTPKNLKQRQTERTHPSCVFDQIIKTV